MENILSRAYQRQHEMMIHWVNGRINTLSDEEYKIELSPGKNHGTWILGHLIACEDDFSLFMGKGELMFPQYQELFGQSSKLRKPEMYPSISQLREEWERVTEKSRKIYSELTDDELSQPHAMVIDYENDFFKTKERIVMAWQFHQLYHTGQLGVIVSSAGKSKY